MQNINLDIVPGDFLQVLRFSQGDIGREFKINLVNYDIPTGATVKLQGTKPSGFGFTITNTGSITNNSITLASTSEMTSEAGKFPAEVHIEKDGVKLGTANLYISVEKDPHPNGTTDGNAEEIIPELTLLVERVEAAASSVLDMQVVANTLPAGSQATYSYDEDENKATFGIPQGEAGAGAAGVVASAYSASSTYAVGDYVIHNSNLYRCTTAITTAEAFTAAHWTQIVLADDVSDLKSDLTDSVLISVTPKWSRQVGSANGIFSAGNGATIHGMSIDSVETIELTNNAKAALFLYRFGAYVGKINANYTVDQVAGSWGYYTGRVNIADILKANNCDEVVITLVPTDGTTLTDGTVESWGNANCKIKKLFYANNEATTKAISTTWKMGAFGADGYTFAKNQGFATSDFISNVQSIIFTSNAKVNVAFYSKFKPIGKISASGAIDKVAGSWGYVFRELNITRYLEEQFASADSIRVTLVVIANGPITNDSEATSFATANCVILQSALTSYPTFASINKPTSSFIKAINHRGFNRFAPENTLPAFAMSKKAGFTDIECDLEWTSDGVPVMLHDSTINRTARNADGTSISSTVNIRDITYEQALSYDFGIWKDPKYTGTKIPTFEQTLVLCKQLGLNIWLDIKDNLTETQANVVINLVKAVGMSEHMVFMSLHSATLEKMKTAFPKATLLTGIQANTEAGVNSALAIVSALKTDDNNVLLSAYATTMTDDRYNQLSNAGVNCILWVDLEYDFTIPFNKNVVGAFTDMQDVGADSIAYAMNNN